MKILIHTRHADLAEDFRLIAEEKLNSMERFSVLIERVEVEILHEANPRQEKITSSHFDFSWGWAFYQIRGGRV